MASKPCPAYTCMRDMIPNPMLSMIDDLLDIENIPGMRLQDRLPIPDVDIDPKDFFLVPPAALSVVPDFDRDLNGKISRLFERSTPANELAGIMATLNFGNADDSGTPLTEDIDSTVCWPSIKCDVQQFYDAVHCGSHWMEEERSENDVLPKLSLDSPTECLYLAKNKTIKANDELTPDDKELLKTFIEEGEGDYISSAFFTNTIKQNSDDCKQFLDVINDKVACRVDPLLPEEAVVKLNQSLEAGIDDSDPYDAHTLQTKSLTNHDKKHGSKKQSFNEWKSVSRRFDPIEFESIRSDLIMEWPFELDDFQKHAIVELERGNSVLVSAHTSAGKTVVAEYAVALSKTHGTRSKFEEVGLVTGDIQLNADSFFVIMTTEILRAMVYNSSPIIHELEWLIFDEVQYVNDIERGVVWEEILILIPAHVKFVMLSATVPNATEFADWIGYKSAMSCYQDRYRVRSASKKKSTWVTFIQHMKNFNLMPLIIFVFSRKLCDEMADLLSSQDFLAHAEEMRVRKLMCCALNLLNDEDRVLDQVVFVTELTLRGIGVHHSGLLPILKEYVEILFTSGLIKVLVATETFAMGVNMPARTVVFSSIYKFDGIGRRILHAGEYTQMSGRAGRRGIDTSGVAIVACESSPPCAEDLTRLIQGSALTLLSKFRLTFAICLKILRTAGISMLKMLRNSFSEFSGVKQSLVAAHDYEEAERLLSSEREKARERGACQHCANGIVKYARSCASYWAAKATTDSVLWTSFCSCRFNHAGRLVYVQASHSHSMVPAVLVEQMHPAQRYVHLLVNANEWNANDECTQSKHSDVLIDNSSTTLPSTEFLSWLPEYANCDAIFLAPLRVRPNDQAAYVSKTRNTRSNAHIVPVVFAQIPTLRLQAFSKLILPDFNLNYTEYRHSGMNRTAWRLMQDGSYIRSPDQTEDIAFQCASFLARLEVLHWSPNIFLNIQHDIGIRRYADCNKQIRLNKLLADQIQSPVSLCPDILEHFNKALRIICLEERIDSLRAEMSDGRLELFEEYKRRLKFLAEMGYLEERFNTGDISLTAKGHAACLVNEKEVVLIELLCSKIVIQSCRSLDPCSNPIDDSNANPAMDATDGDVMGPYPLASLAAILSTLVCTGRDVGNEISPASVLEDDAKPAMNSFIQLINELDSKLCEHDLSDYKILPTLNRSLVQLVYRWACGDCFKSCMMLTQQQEGIVVKCIQRIADVCKEMQRAARYFTYLEMLERLGELRRILQRGVVFTRSLYNEEDMENLND